mgnify:FL=1
MCKLSIGKLRKEGGFTEFEAQVLNYTAEHTDTLEAGSTFQGVPGHPRYGSSTQEMRVERVDENGARVLWVNKGRALEVDFNDYFDGRKQTTTTPTTTTTTQPTTPPTAAPAQGTDDVLTALGGLFEAKRLAGYQAAKQEDAATIEDIKQQLEAAQKTGTGTTINVTIDGVTHTHETPKILDKGFKMLVNMLGAHENIYLYGPAGSGKNVLCEELAAALGVEFYYQNTILTKFDLSGYKNAGGEFEETEFFKAWTKGGLFMLDECDNSQAEALVALNAALANGYYTFPGVGKVAAHENFYCVAAGNTNGQGATEEYCGRYKMDESSRDRFFFYEVSYDPRIEEAISSEHPDVIEFVRALRTAAATLQLPLICGYRAITKLNKFYDMDAADLLNGFILRGMQVDDIRELSANLSSLKGNRFAAALVGMIK